MVSSDISLRRCACGIHDVRGVGYLQCAIVWPVVFMRNHNHPRAVVQSFHVRIYAAIITNSKHPPRVVQCLPSIATCEKKIIRMKQAAIRTMAWLFLFGASIFNAFRVRLRNKWRTGWSAKTFSERVKGPYVTCGSFTGATSESRRCKHMPARRLTFPIPTCQSQHHMDNICKPIMESTEYNSQHGTELIENKSRERNGQRGRGKGRGRGRGYRFRRGNKPRNHDGNPDASSWDSGREGTAQASSNLQPAAPAFVATAQVLHVDTVSRCHR